LRTWIDEQREDLLVRRRLEAAVAEWQSGREDDSYLPGGGRLAQFAQWSSTTSLAMSPDQRRFLDAAQRQEDEAAVRAARRRRRLLVGLSAVSVLLAVAAVFSLVQRRNADETARDAETNRLAATASVVAEGNPRLGLLVAAEAYSRAETVETLGALQRTMLEVAPFTAFSNATALHLDWQADRIFLLTDDGIEVLNAQTREQTHRFEFEPGFGGWRVSPDRDR
jgi:hypothetical protein